MFYCINPKVQFRNFNQFGYITDNRNYSYLVAKGNPVLGDEIVSASGTTILSCMSKLPSTLEDIVALVAKRFEDVDIEQLTDDAEIFLSQLVNRGFVLCGET